MLWIVLSITTAFLDACKNTLNKHIIGKIKPAVLAFYSNTLTVCLLLPFLVLQGLPEIKTLFWPIVVINAFANALATIWYMRSLSLEDMSLAIPLLSFTPLFLLITGPVLLREIPSPIGILGVLLIIVGSYILNITKRSEGVWTPLKSLATIKGTRYMLGVAIIWSVSSSLDKIGVQTSSSLFYLVVVFGLSAFFILLALKIIHRPMAIQLQDFKSLLVVSGVKSTQLFVQMTAIQLAQVTYVISIKRTATLFSIIFAYLFFKEKNIMERLAGGTIMLIGAILITLA